MTVWHVLLYAVGAFVALRSFIHLAERRTATRPKRSVPEAGSGYKKAV